MEPVSEPGPERAPVESSAPPPGWTDPAAVAPGGPPPPEPVPRARRPLLWLGAATLVALGAFLLLSLRDGGPSGGPFAPIADAALKTGRTSGARIAGTGSVSAAGGQFTMQFSGEYDGRHERSSMRMQVQSSQSPQVAELMNPFVAVQDGLVTYMSTPAFSGQLPAGKTWMSIDASDFAGAEEQTSAVDAGALLDELRAAGAEASRVGTERVRGARTVRYSAVIEDDEGSSNVGVWVDRRQRIRRLVMLAPFNLPGQPPTVMSIQIEFYDFGIDPRIGVPPASATFDATGLARQGYEQALEAS